MRPTPNPATSRAAVRRRTWLACGCSLLFAVSPVEASAQSAAEVVDSYIAAINAYNEESQLAVLAPDVVIYDQLRDSAVVGADGREAAADRLAETRAWFEEYSGRLDVLERIVSDNLVVQRERYTLRFDDGSEDTWVDPAMYRVLNDEIYRIWSFSSEIMDPEQVPQIADAAHPPGEGPIVWIDEAHHNMHGAEGTYWAFGEMLRRDGYRMYSWTRAFTDSVPGPTDVLVISNALAERNVSDWTLPTPSAYTEEEIERLAGWVKDGGGLLLIADHMPFPGAAADLAEAFGFEFSNGFAIDTAVAGLGSTFQPFRGVSFFTFRRADGTLAPHPIREGLGASTRVDSVSTYTGQAFRAPAAAIPLYVLPSTTISLLPHTAWEFSAATLHEPADGWVQGAALEFGDGRVVVFGEAAQFRPRVPGLHGDNGRYARNVIAWLAGTLE